jgi:hypothetical protein
VTSNPCATRSELEGLTAFGFRRDNSHQELQGTGRQQCHAQ